MALHTIEIRSREECRYDPLRERLGALKATLQRHDQLQIICPPELLPYAEVALHDMLPTSQRDGLIYTHAEPSFGHWVTDEPPPGDALAFLPYINREDLLEKAVLSVRAQVPTMVIDQSEQGWTPLSGVYCQRFERLVDFTEMTNWAFTYALSRGVRWLCFMHSDAEIIADAATLAIAHAKQNGAALTFTNYDAFAVFDLALCAQWGLPDESFPWYVIEDDYHHRMRRLGLQTLHTPGVEVLHHVSQTLKSFPRRSQRARTIAMQESSTAQLGHKWGVIAEAKAEPYDGGAYVRVPTRSLRYFVEVAEPTEEVRYSELKRHIEALPPLATTSREQQAHDELEAARVARDALLDAHVVSECRSCPLTAELGEVPTGAALDPFRQKLSLHHLAKKPKCALFSCAFKPSIRSGDMYVPHALPAATLAPGRCAFLGESACALGSARAPACHRIQCQKGADISALAAAQDRYARAYETVSVFAADGDPVLPFGLQALLGFAPA